MPQQITGGYAPPDVYTNTEYNTAPTPAVVPPRISVYVGTGQEILSKTDLPVARGSSSSINQRVVDEDEAGRMVLSVNPDGSLVLGNYNGVASIFQVRNFPIVSGDGTATPATNVSAVSVTINGTPIVVLSISATKGLVEIAATPNPGDVVLCTYYFDRTDTLITDDLSAQVTSTAATIYGTNGQNFSFTAGVNDVFSLIVDGTPVSITMPSSSPSVAAAVVVAVINSTPGISSLKASSFVNNFARVCIKLTADHSIMVGSGTANTILGFTPGALTARNNVFYTFNGPIVTGNNGGITTTSTSDVVVTVNGTAVTPVSVNGATRAITLPYAPAAGSTVTVKYYFNTWQNTFDYLANSGIISITNVGVSPGASAAGTYLPGVNYILANDRIVWGTASLVDSGISTTGSTLFGGSQVQTSLIDNQVFMAPCTSTVDTSGPVTVPSSTVFQLPFQPTTGNGLGNPLGANLYQTVANGRIDLPTTRPDLVQAYWGFDLLDAQTRGPVTVLEVDPTTSRITLASPVPEGASVYASFYYSTLVDQTFIGSSKGYTITCVSAGPGGAGTYSVVDGSGVSRFGVSYVGKGSALSTITVNFPSGSEFYPDARIEGGLPVEETVTVTFAAADPTPARYTTPSPSPYYFINGESDHLAVTIDGVDDNTGGSSANIHLSSPTGGSRIGAFASLLSNQIQYTASSGETTYPITAGADDNINLNVDNVPLVANAAAGATQTAAAYVTAINNAAVAGGAADPYYTSAGDFANGYTVTASKYDQLTLSYFGSSTGPSGSLTITLAPGTYASVGSLVTQINTQLTTINAGGGLFGTVVCSADANDRLRFTCTLAAGDAALTGGYFEFINGGTPARDFAIIAGIDTGTANGQQTKVYNGPIARRFSVSVPSSRLPYDRIILRNRIFPGSGSITPHSSLAQTVLASQGGNGAVKSGLPSGAFGEASAVCSVFGPTLIGQVGWSGGIASTFGDARDGQPLVTFYDGSNPAFVANNQLVISVGTSLLTVNFTASGTGTATALGPIGSSGSVLGQISAAISAASLSSIMMVSQEGDGIRLWVYSPTLNSTLTVGVGSANVLLGFTAGDGSSITPVTARQMASAMMSQAQAAGSFGSFMTAFASPSSTYFAGRALAGVELDSSNNTYLYTQSLTTGVSSSILFKAPATASALSHGTMFLTAVGDGSSGRSAVSGFFVTSSNPVHGSGSANTSVLNNGVGQDGSVGQTYIDKVTGLTFTILPRIGGLPYPTGGTSTVTFRSSKTIVTDGNIPTRAIPGLLTTVTNTTGVAVGDTVLVSTFDHGGEIPAIGQVYYISYTYEKTDFTTKLWYRLSDVTAEYGPATPDNPLSLAAYVAFQCGSTIIGTLQVKKTPGSSSASEAAYINALNTLAGNSLPNNIPPSVLCLLTPATVNLAKQVATHCDVQSSQRFRAERTAIFGFASGTGPTALAPIISAAGSPRVRFVYPDVFPLSLTDVFGTVTNYLVDGRFAAAGLTAATTSPSVDAATPWEGLKVIGFSGAGRILDEVTMNSIATLGCTVLTYSSPFLNIRNGLTSDMTNIFTKLPTVTQIADEMQRRARIVLGGFIGAKFIPQVLGQIEGRLSEMFKQAISDQIINSYANVQVTSDPTDPTAIIVNAFYVPVFPLLYIQMTFRVSSS